jgi:hypothetical protein
MAEVRKKFDLFMIVNITILCLFGLITLLPVMNVVAKAFSGEGPVIKVVGLSRHKFEIS